MKMKKWIGLFIVMLITLSGISAGASELPAELLENADDRGRGYEGGDRLR